MQEVKANKSSRQAKKRRHHYLPEFYLRGFVDPDNEPYLWIYEKGDTEIRKASPKDAAVLRNYYSFTTPEGEKDSETFEDFLAEIETQVAPILQKIQAEESLEQAERQWFALFVALIMTRVPNWRENSEKGFAQVIKKCNKVWAAHDEGFRTWVAGFETSTGKKINTSIEELQKTFLEERYDLKVNPQLSLDFILLAVKLSPVFYDMTWSFLKATDDYKFVTSDNPIHRRTSTPGPPPFAGVGLLNKNVELTLPISKDLAFLGSWKDVKGYVQLNNQMVREITRRTVLSASRFVFAPLRSQALNRLVQKCKDTAPKIIIG